MVYIWLFSLQIIFLSCLSKFLKSFVFHEKIFFISVDFCSSYLGKMCQVDFLDVQHDLNSLQNWSLTDNEIFFQPSKCVNLTITRKRQRLYRLMDKDLKFVSSAKDLGFTVLKDLKWTAHIAQVVAKSKRMLGFLKRNCSGDLNKESLKLLYISLVCSNLCYASQLWAPQSPTLMLELENIQRRATRFILNLNLLPLNYWLEYLDYYFSTSVFMELLLLI